MLAGNKMKTSILDINKKLPWIDKSPSLNNIGFALFKHSCKTYGGSKFLNFTPQGVILIFFFFNNDIQIHI